METDTQSNIMKRPAVAPAAQDTEPKCAKVAPTQLPLEVVARASSVNHPHDDVTVHLLTAGLPLEVAVEKRAMFAMAAQRLLDEGLDGKQQAKAFWVPGRIEVAGKHTDYAGGRSLLAATSKGFAIVSTDRDDDACHIFTTFGLSREKRHVALNISKDLEPKQGHWSAYPATAIRRIARNFDIHQGANIAIECDLPESSGMSTSSAVICFMWMILAERNCVQKSVKFKDNLRTDEELYSYLGFIENGQNCGTVLVGDKGVGTFGGSEDHTGIMSSKAGELRMYSYCPTKHEGTFAFPADVTFVIAVSGALAEKTGDAMADYNNASFLARDAAKAWCDGAGAQPLGGNTFVPGCSNLAEVVRHVRAEMGDDGRDNDKVKSAIVKVLAEVDDGKSYGPVLNDSSVRYRSGALQTRFEQFFDESEVLVRGIAEAFAVADYERLGRLSDESHRLTVEYLQNTIPETAWLPQEARRLGALGASAFGAGFGGSCWALVKTEDCAKFMERWKLAYVERFPKWATTCSFFHMRPGPGAFLIQ